MKTTKSELQHITGNEAYLLYWEQIYECRPRLSTIMAIDRNLEIIVDADLKILAYRYDVPDDMMWMVINAGRWKIVNDKNYDSEVIDEVSEMIVNNKREMCLN